jgi:hypothetical protein
VRETFSTPDPITDLSSDRNGFFVESGHRVLIGFMMIAIASNWIWQIVEIVSLLPKGH